MSDRFDLLQMLLETYEAAKAADDLTARVKVIELLAKMGADGKTVKRPEQPSDLDAVLQARNSKPSK